MATPICTPICKWGQKTFPISGVPICDSRFCSGVLEKSLGIARAANAAMASRLGYLSLHLVPGSSLSGTESTIRSFITSLYPKELLLKLGTRQRYECNVGVTTL